MMTSTSPEIETLADLLDRLGGISPARVRFTPSPGTATEADVIEAERTTGRLYELVDGVLVEKGMGFRESVVAAALSAFLRAFVVPRKLGVVAGADGTLRLTAGLVRIPDVAFVSRDRLPTGGVPEQAIPDLVPDLAVEVLSDSNTSREIARKSAEYLAAGVRLIWLVEIRKRSVTVLSAPDHSSVIEGDATLDGADVLPGFRLPLRELFADLDLNLDRAPRA